MSMSKKLGLKENPWNNPWFVIEKKYTKKFTKEQVFELLTEALSPAYDESYRKAMVDQWGEKAGFMEEDNEFGPVCP